MYVLILGQSFSKHLHNLTDMFDIFGGRAQVETIEVQVWLEAFLGHIVSDQGIALDPAKIAVISNWSTPRCYKEVQQFLGLGNFYHHFLQDLATIAKPLHWLTKKDQESCGQRHVRYLFRGSKGSYYPYPSLPSLTLQRHSCWTLTDASNEGQDEA